MWAGIIFDYLKQFVTVPVISYYDPVAAIKQRKAKEQANHNYCCTSHKDNQIAGTKHNHSGSLLTPLNYCYSEQSHYSHHQ